jgi:hypothetical protein
MRKHLLIPIAFFCFYSCKEGEQATAADDVTIANALVVSATDKAKIVEEKGIDSYVAYLVNDKRDTFHIEYGDRGIINSLYEPGPSVFPLSQKQGTIERAGKEPSTDEVLFSEYPEQDREQKIFDKNYVMYDTVNTIVAKLVQPKRIGDGITGLYIPRLKDGKSFSIYATNLDSAGHRRALQMFRTIKYK